MVVAVATSNPTAKPHKNRRKQTKKPAKATDTVDHSSTLDVDEDMTAVETVEGAAESSIPTSFPDGEGDDDLIIEMDDVPSSSAPSFPPLPASAMQTTLKSETRRITIPPHRMTPLKKDWISIFGPLTEILGLQVRMNVQRKCVEVRVRNI